MAKRRYGFDEEKITRFLKEGRGEGHGKDYQPWLTIQDVSSHGRSTRIHCRKTQREHHLLSDNETAVFLLLDWSDSVTDAYTRSPTWRVHALVQRQEIVGLPAWCHPRRLAVAMIALRLQPPWYIWK